ncbi:MAG: thioredoxin family protein [Ruminococcus sp.]|nr:thioredoxin family protein [Ruminococcus sp.]
MSILGFGKKKEEEKKASCCCGTAETEVTSEVCCGGTSATSDNCCGETLNGICCIKVLGAGCKSCHEQYQNVINAAAEMGLATNIEYITDMEKIMTYGVMSMPAIVVNEKVVSMGRVLKTADVVKLLNQLI